MHFKKFVFIDVVIVAMLALGSCLGSGGGSSSSDSSAGSGSLSTATVNGSTDSNGVAQLAFTVTPGTTAVQLNAATSGGTIELTSLVGPSGDLLANNVTEVSSSMTAQPGSATFNFPTLQSGVSPGNYTARFQVTVKNSRTGQAHAAVSLSVVQRDIVTRTSGTLPVNIIFVGPTAGSENTVEAIQGTVEVWQGIFAGANISLDVQYYNFDGPNMLPDPRAGDPLYTQISSATRQDALNVVIGVDVTGIIGERNEGFGTVGSIPGPILPGPHSVAAFSILKVAGQDGRFNYDGPGAVQLWDDEIEIGGEVLAQLAGEYLGLQPAVTLQGNRVIATDRLDDTATCVTEVECENEDQPRDNFMFPRVYFKPNEGLKTYGRTDSTPEQSELMLQSPLVQ